MSCHLLNDGTNTRAVVIEEHIKNVRAVLNMCVAFPVQPAGVRLQT